MRYAVARYRIYQKETAYRIYCSECLRIITENTAKASGGAYMSMHFSDVLKHKKGIDDRTPEQILNDTIRLGGLEVIQ